MHYFERFDAHSKAREKVCWGRVADINTCSAIIGTFTSQMVGGTN